MSKIIILAFMCKRCGITFMSYCEGQYIYCREHEEGICFNDENIGVIHDNHYLNTIKGLRECRTCRKAGDLLNYV